MGRQNFLKQKKIYPTNKQINNDKCGGRPNGKGLEMTANKSKTLKTLMINH